MVRPTPQQKTPDRSRDEMAATYTFDGFFTLDGYGSYAPLGRLGGYREK